MNDNQIRFYASPEEKMAHVGGSRPQMIDYRTRYPDSVVSVIINGNSFQVSLLRSLSHRMTRALKPFPPRDPSPF